VNSETYRFKVDTLECMAVRNFMHTYTASRFFTNAPAQDLKEALREHSLEPEEITSPSTCLFIDTRTNRVLVDTGAGIGVHPEIGPYEGRLRKNLQAEGVGAADIDTVIYGAPSDPSGASGVAYGLLRP
jgi:glyoxylase-like metal-dependent hydrolase (beta-lactamase superfamily II)